MTLNRRGEWFFPASRMDDPNTAQQLVQYEFKLKAKYLGEIDPVFGQTVETEQDMAHLGPRRYTFYIYKANFPKEKLGVPGNQLEIALQKAGINFSWVSERKLDPLATNISPTVEKLREAVLSMDC
jgi:hypothetical protein